MSDLVPFLVTIPIVAATAPPVLARRFDRIGWPVAAVGLLAQTVLAAWVAWTVAVDGPMQTVVGGLPATLGIELAVDRLSAVFVLLVAVAGLWGLAYTRRGGPRTATGYTLYLLLVAGSTGICVTRDVFNLYVFLEISGLSAYALVAVGDDAGAAPAALKYLLVGTVGASLYLLGVGYLYVATGTLNMGALSSLLATVGYDDRLVLAAFGLVVVGLGVKIALFPVHTWKPDAYQTAPAGIAAVLAVIVSTVAAYALIRLLVSVFTVDFLAANQLVVAGLQLAAVVSIVVGAALALLQRDVRRMLAYSSVSQLGIVVAGVALGTPLGIVGGVVHLLGHAVMKGGAFAAVGVVESATDARTVDEFAGTGDHLPVTSAVLATLSLGLVGIPPLVGFFGKWYVVLSAVRTGAWAVAVAVLVSTVLSLTYFARLVQRLYLEPGDRRVDPGSVSPGMVAAGVVAALVALALGFASAGLADLLLPAVEGGRP
ncbi:complex I subunit 5 family protein [Haloarchaeobius sp. HRN-SO-5]|uniref:complex I subunit 5 family protein n=1 Tax=Haloarchaeobius sp. HRN-SO-5 TaxID=3446118 RepID=UPI003EBE27F5